MGEKYFVIFNIFIALLVSTKIHGQIVNKPEFYYSDDQESFIRLDSLAESGNFKCVDELCRAAYYSDGALAEMMPEFLNKGINNFPEEYMSYFTIFPNVMECVALLIGFNFALLDKDPEEISAEICRLKVHIIKNLNNSATLYKTATIFMDKVNEYYKQCLDN